MANTTWNSADKTANLTLTNGNLTATGAVFGAPNIGAVRSVAVQTTGKYYWEYTPNVLNQTSTSFGIANASAALPPTGNLVNACGVGFTGIVALNGSPPGVSIGTITFGASGRVCVALDMTGKLIWFRGSPTNQWNNGGTANPATGVGGLDISAITTGGIFAFFQSCSTDQCIANFGDTAFSGAVPSGFTAGFPAGGGAAVAQARAMILA